MVVCFFIALFGQFRALTGKISTLLGKTNGSLLLVAFACFAGNSLAGVSTPDSLLATAHNAAASKQHLPTLKDEVSLVFEQNEGQFAPEIDFISRSKGYNVVLTSSGPIIELYKTRIPAQDRIGVEETAPAKVEIEAFESFRIGLKNANRGTKVSALLQQKAVTNYLVGSDKKNWHTNIKNFGRVAYKNIYDDIDVHYYGDNGRLEFEFIIKPGADSQQIAMNFAGISQFSVNEKGNLVLVLEKGKPIVQEAPIAYQETAEGITEVEVSYRIEEKNVYFDLAAYDSTKPLVIDPVIQYSSYYGGSGQDQTAGGGVDAAGNIYAIGTTTSVGLGTAGAFVETNENNRAAFVSFPSCNDCTDTPPGGQQVERTIISNSNNIFVSKFDSDGDTLLYTTYIKPSATDPQELRLGVNSMGVSPAGEVAIGLDGVGDGMPLVNSTQSFAPAQSNAYIAKLNAAGSGLVFSTYLNLGTFNFFASRGLAVGPGGEVAAVGSASIFNDFPEVNALAGQSCTPGNESSGTGSDFMDAYIAYFNTGGTLTFSSCFGGETKVAGSVGESARGVDIGPNGHLYVVGYTAFDDFPLVNPIQSTHGYSGSRDMFITEIDPDPAGSSIVFSTLFGPSSSARAPAFVAAGQAFFPIDIKADASGNIWTTGGTNELDYPTINAAQPQIATPKSSNTREFANPAEDMFLTKIHPTNGIIFSTFVGGSLQESALPTLAIDSAGNSYLLGVSDSDDYPTASPIQANKAGSRSIVLSKFSPLGRMSFSTFLGGTEDQIEQVAGGIAVNNSNEIVVVGVTTADDLPTVSPLQAARAGDFDATITIISQSADADTDGDGVIDSSDAFPEDPAEWLNTDGDLIGNNSDPDDDGDNVLDGADAFPLDDTESLDDDGDGIGNNLDQFDSDPTEAFDLDDDGIGDFTDLDIDGDGVDNGGQFNTFNGLDAFVFDATRSVDTDGDGIDDPADTDDDNDGFLDVDDPEPLNSEIPLITFETFNPLNTDLFKSPLPDEFSAVAGSDASWALETGNAFAGSNSLGSIPIQDNQSAEVQIVSTLGAGTISFQYDVDSQEAGDIFLFFLDDVQMLSVSGRQLWTKFETQILEGKHTLRWVYQKDSATSTGSDSVRIDNILLPPKADDELCIPIKATNGKIVLVCL